MSDYGRILENAKRVGFKPFLEPGEKDDGDWSEPEIVGWMADEIERLKAQANWALSCLASHDRKLAEHIKRETSPNCSTNQQEK